MSFCSVNFLVESSTMKDGLATGATMLTQAPHRIEIGSWIELDVEGDCAVVAIQRIAETTDPAALVYRVEFVMLAPTLRARVEHTIAAHLGNRGLHRGATPPLLAPSQIHQLQPTGREQNPTTSDTAPFAGSSTSWTPLSSLGNERCGDFAELVAQHLDGVGQ